MRDTFLCGCCALALSVMVMAASTAEVAAGQLVYRPTNPSFGGDPLRGSFLLDSAALQNQFTGGGGEGGGGDVQAPDINVPDFSDFNPSVVIDLGDTTAPQATPQVPAAQ